MLKRYRLKVDLFDYKAGEVFLEILTIHEHNKKCSGNIILRIKSFYPEGIKESTCFVHAPSYPQYFEEVISEEKRCRPIFKHDNKDWLPHSKFFCFYCGKDLTGLDDTPICSGERKEVNS